MRTSSAGRCCYIRVAVFTRLLCQPLHCAACLPRNDGLEPFVYTSRCPTPLEVRNAALVLASQPVPPRHPASSRCSIVLPRAAQIAPMATESPQRRAALRAGVRTCSVQRDPLPDTKAAAGLPLHGTIFTAL